MSYPPVFYKQPPMRDVYDGENITIQHTHAEIHDGDSYVLTMVQTMTASSTLNCMFTAPNNDDVRIHFVMGCEASGNGITVSIYEGTTATSGTPITAVNRNRNSSNVTRMVSVHTPTISDNGTLIFSRYLAATKQSGSVEHATEELILKKGTKYLVTLVADSGASAVFNGRADWYETPKGGGD